MYDIIGLVAIYAMLFVALLTPIFIVVQSILNFRRASQARGSVIFKALSALIIWVVLSCGMMFMSFVTIYSAAHAIEPDTAGRGVALSFLVLGLIYVLAGGALAYWVRHQPKWMIQAKA